MEIWAALLPVEEQPNFLSAELEGLKSPNPSRFSLISQAVALKTGTLQTAELSLQKDPETVSRSQCRHPKVNHSPHESHLLVYLHFGILLKVCKSLDSHKHITFENSMELSPKILPRILACCSDLEITTQLRKLISSFLSSKLSILFLTCCESDGVISEHS